MTWYWGPFVGWGLFEGDWLDQTGFRKRGVSTILRNGFQGASRDLNRHEFLEFRNPDALGAKVRGEIAGRHSGDVHTDATFFLGETSAMNFRTAYGTRTGDGALSGHNEIY